jgi:mannose-6-phosphate isomerase
MSISAPLTFNGRVRGVMRYVTSMSGVQQELKVTVGVAAGALLLCVAMVYISNMVFINNVVQPVAEVTATAKRIADGTICEVLQKHEVKSGDVFFIPAGRVHAICGGIMVAEIQQSSNITYRIFDYNRMGLDGKPRQLHTEEAVDAIDYTVYDDYRTSYERKINKPVPLVVTPFFVVKLLEVDRSFHRKLYKYDSFIAYMCLQGDCTIRIKSTQGFGNGVMPAEEDTIVRLTEGNSCLIPASVADLYIAPNNSAGVTKLLETYIDNKNY